VQTVAVDHYLPRIGPCFIDALAIVVRPGRVDQLICLATGTAIVEPICLSTRGFPAPFETATSTLGVDSLSRQPSADWLLLSYHHRDIDRQTDRHDRNNIPHHFEGGQKLTGSVWLYAAYRPI